MDIKFATEIDDDLHARFKARSSSSKKSMKAATTEALNLWIAEMDGTRSTSFADPDAELGRALRAYVTWRIEKGTGKVPSAFLEEVEEYAAELRAKRR